MGLLNSILHSRDKPKDSLNGSRYSFFFGGTSLLIMVTVTLDTISQIQSHLIAQQYEGLVKRSRLGGRKR